MSTQYQDVVCNLAMPDLSRYRQIIPAHLPSLPLDQKRQLPNIPAVYFVLGEGNEVLYIGRSGSLSTRWLAHHRLSDLLDVGNVRLAWIEFETEEFLCEVERVLIDHFSPKLNSQRAKTNADDYTGKGVYTKQVQAKLRQVLFRVSDEEFESMQRAAEAEDRTVSAWVRVKIRNSLREPDIAQEKKEQ